MKLPGGLLMVQGPNFSGRTEFLERNTGVQRSCLDPESSCAYISSSIFENLSGIALTVKDELLIHGRLTPEIDLEEWLGVANLSHRDIWTLSGGELTKLVLCAALRLRTQVLAIDCALEQLDTDARDHTYTQLAQQELDRTVLVADNRSACRRFGRVLANLKTSKAGLLLKPSSTLIDQEVIKVEPQRLELIGLKASYGSHKVLNDINWLLEPGNIYFLNGVNGAGKSTLAKVLTGVLRPADGKIHVSGRHVCPWRSGNNLLALHFQNPDVGQTKETQTQEARVMNERFGKLYSERERDDYCAIWRAAFGLNMVSIDPTASLPFVLRKRADLCACLSSGASWYFLDEPTIGQDDDFVRNLAVMLDTLRRVGAGIIIVSHDNPLQKYISGHSATLESGYLISKGLHVRTFSGQYSRN